MISRVYVKPKGLDNRARLYLNGWSGLVLKNTKLQILDSYKIKRNLKSKDLEKIANFLTNPILEELSINKLPSSIENFTYAVEIGYLPGVTDNVGHTVKETITDLLHLKNNSNLEVYTSKVFLISGNIKLDAVKKVASSLHNPLIESSFIASAKEIKKGLPLKAPTVILKKNIPVIKVPLLDLFEEELIKIGREGIKEEKGNTRRGPLALDLPSMKAIQTYFAKLKKNPTHI